MTPYLRAANVKDGQLLLEDVLNMNFTESERDVYQLLPGDVLVTEGCGSIRELGASARWDGSIEGAVCYQNTLLRLRAIPGLVLPGFLEHWARWAHRSGIWAATASGTNIFHIGVQRAREVTALLPPIAEQRRIVDLLDTLDRVIAAARHHTNLAIESTDRLRSDLLSRVLEVSPSASLGEVLERVRRPIPVSPDEEYRQIGIRSHARGIFHKDPVAGAGLGSKKVFRIEPGDLVFNIVFAWERAVAVARETEVGMCGSHRFPTYRPSTGVEVDYFRHFFTAPVGAQLLQLASPGSAGRNRTLNQSMLMSFAVPSPDPVLARKVTALLAAAEELVNRSDRAVHAAIGLRQAALNELLSGAHEIPDSYDELLERAS